MDKPVDDYILNAPDEDGRMFLVVRNRTKSMALVPLQLHGDEQLETMFANFERALVTLEFNDLKLEQRTVQ